MKTLANKISLSLILCFTLVVNTMAQKDTSFWFVAPDISQAHGDRPVYFRFSTFEKTANVQITMPAQDEPIIEEVTIPANGEYSYLISNPELFETPEGNIKNNGILIKSNTPITAYYEVAGTSDISKNNTDIFALKGQYALGKDFIIPMQSFFSNQFNLGAQSSFEVVATEDNTVIEVVPTSTLYIFGNDDTVTITLNKGQTYAFRALTENSGLNNLTGTTIKSSKPIAVTITDDSVLNRDFWDLIGDQLIPIHVAGTKYVVPIGYIAIVSRNDITFTVKELSAGVLVENTYELNANNNHALTFENNYPQLLDFSDTAIVKFVDIYGSGESTTDPIPSQGGELGGAIIPPIVCSGSREVAFIRSSDTDFFVYLVFRTSAINDFILNDTPFAIDSSETYLVDSNLSYIKMELDQIEPNIGQRFKNTSAPFHLAIGNGSLITGYQVGYFSNFRNQLEDTLYTCQDYASFEEYYNTLDLYGEFKIDTIFTNNLDTSFAKIEIQDEYCLLIDSTWLINAKPPILGLPDTFIICQNIDSTLSFTEHIVIFDDVQKTNSLRLEKDSVTVYLENESGCNITKTAQIIHLDSLNPVLPSSTIFCDNDSLSFDIEGVFDSVYINNTVNTSFLITTDSLVEITVNNQCGTISNTLTFTKTPLPTISLGADREVCSLNNRIVLPETYTYLWHDAISLNNYEIYTSGLHIVIATDTNNCEFTDSVNIVYKDISEIEDIDDSKICSNKSLEISLKPGHDSYIWNDNTNSNQRSLDSGYYEVKIITLVNDTVCYQKDIDFEITTWNLEIPNIITPNNDDKNETFQIVGLDEKYPLQLTIINRWDKEIFFTEEYNNEWGGDDSLSEGVYYYHTISQEFDCTDTKGYIFIKK